jgi:hypothetical protein
VAHGIGNLPVDRNGQFRINRDRRVHCLLYTLNIHYLSSTWPFRNFIHSKFSLFMPEQNAPGVPKRILLQPIIYQW